MPVKLACYALFALRWFTNQFHKLCAKKNKTCGAVTSIFIWFNHPHKSSAKDSFCFAGIVWSEYPPGVKWVAIFYTSGRPWFFLKWMERHELGHKKLFSGCNLHIKFTVLDSVVSDSELFERFVNAHKYLQAWWLHNVGRWNEVAKVH